MHRRTIAVLAVAGALLTVDLAGPARAATPLTTPVQPALVRTAAGAPVSAASGWLCDAKLPTRLRHIGNAKQVVVAVADSWGSSYGTLRVFRQVAGSKGTGWCRVLGPVPARFGYNGLAPAKQRLKGTGTTPAGTFRLPYAFGLQADPGTRLPYIRSDSNDYWPLDTRSAATFNTYQRNGVKGFRASESEHIASFGTQYAHAVVLGYNLPQPGKLPNVRKGGAIFLHVNGAGATAGCVSVEHTTLDAILRILKPAASPRIVVTTRSALASA